MLGLNISLSFGRGEGRKEIQGISPRLSKIKWFLQVRVESESKSLKERLIESEAPYWIILIIFQWSDDFDILSSKLFYA